VKKKSKSSVKLQLALWYTLLLGVVFAVALFAPDGRPTRSMEDAQANLIHQKEWMLVQLEDLKTHPAMERA
jgi:hypothetical protein